MKIETVSEVTSDRSVGGDKVYLTIRHDSSYTKTFHLQAGCVDEWLDIDELTELRNVCNAGLRIAKKVHT